MSEPTAMQPALQGGDQHLPHDSGVSATGAHDQSTAAGYPVTTQPVSRGSDLLNPQGANVPAPGVYQLPSGGYQQPQAAYLSSPAGYQYAASPGGYAPPAPGYNVFPQGIPLERMPPGMGMPPPQPVQWMERPLVAGCPPGLECLAQLDHLIVNEQINLLEVLVNWATCSRYDVKNSSGQEVYFAMEESDEVQRRKAGQSRGFIIHVTDNVGQEVIRVTREYKDCAGCSWCANSDTCAWLVVVEAPVGQIVGYVRQMRSCSAPCYIIMDSQHTIVLRIEGPAIMCQDGLCCKKDLDFVLYSADKAQEIGKISKQWGGELQEYYTSATNFGMSFPVDLDVRIKAVVLGALFLIDYMHFETAGRPKKSK